METLNDANGSIQLDRTTVELVDGPSCPAQVVLRLSPVPTIHFDLLDSSPEFQRALFDASLKHGPMVVELPLGEKVQVLESNQSLIPTSGPVTALDTGKPLHAVRFGVINFPDFMKPKSTESETDAETPWSIEDLRTIHLEGGSWLVEIRPVGNHEQVHKSLRQQRGFALTHWGRVSRLDGEPFPKESVQQFMATLNQFLSFARGVSCGMTLIKGLDEAGETVWEEWGVTKVQPWKGHRSCLDIRNGATLEDLFAGFWCYSQAHPGDPFTALEWYLESNAQEALHTSIVLTQAALERLTDQKVSRSEVQCTKSQNCTKSQKEKEGVWIARALCKVKADLRVPESLREASGNAKGFDHGPHALVTIRNDLAHAEMKKGILSFEAYRQARELGLWYIELLLLELFEYSGLYSNRLTRKWTGDVETVPWASPV